MLQSLPFLIPDLPIGVHRAWQVILWILMLGMLSVAVTRRWVRSARLAQAVVLAWSFLFLFQGPVYFHLVLAALPVIWGFDARRPWRTLAWVLLGSAWAGLGRVNWYPVPGMLAAALYALEMPSDRGNRWRPRDWLWPLLWMGAGSLTAFLASTGYALASGNDLGQFASSFTSDLLWYRLLPNATYLPGVVLSLFAVSVPIVLLVIWVARLQPPALDILRLALPLAILGTLLMGGLVVSVKIGGGGDLHNLDAFLLLLLIIGGGLLWKWDAFPLPGKLRNTPIRQLGWTVLLVPVLVSVARTAGLPAKFDRAEAESLAVLRQQVSEAVDSGGEVLLLTQRHLLTFGEVVAPLVEPYEKVYLMEMAMAGHEPYLQRFYSDLDRGRFALIVSEPLHLQRQGRGHAFGEENDVWVERVAEPILERYTLEEELGPIKVWLLAPSGAVVGPLRMFWLRSFDPVALLLLAGVSALWVSGGVLLARHAFGLEPGERLLAGAVMGLAAYIVVVNLLGRLGPWAFWAGGMLVFALGCSAGLRSPVSPFVGREDLRGWKVILPLLVIVVAVALTGRGLGIFDDRENLSIISLMAAGDIPVHFYMDGVVTFRYHYGSQLYAASLMRLGNMYPWSAFDLAKGVFAGLALGTAYLVGRRLAHRVAGGWLVAVVVLLAGGSRWLLLGLPAPWLDSISQTVNLVGSGRSTASSLMGALHRGWVVSGGPPMPIPFAFASGISEPFILGLQSTAIGLSHALTFLFLLLAGRLRGWRGVVALALVLASWALAWETDFFLIGAGIVGVSLWMVLRMRRTEGERQALLAMSALAIAALTALVQGGTSTEVLRLLSPGAAPGAASGIPFSLRWPPAVVSAHLGELSLGNPSTLVAGLAELGLAVLAIPLATWWGIRRLRRGSVAEPAVLMAAWAG